jgi:hypothetical protein
MREAELRPIVFKKIKNLDREKQMAILKGMEKIINQPL